MYIVVLGSSYSSSLALIAANENPDVDAAMAFSPAENVRLHEKSVADNVKDLKKPVFITSASGEEQEYKYLAEEIISDNRVIFLPTVRGAHGASSLWPDTPDNEVFWEAVKAFLMSL